MNLTPARPCTPLQNAAPERWHLVCHSLPAVAGQMALDTALWQAVCRGQRPPTLRLYDWHSPAVTLGRLQSPEALPLPTCQRLTGGRAVYHDRELTISISLPAGHRLISSRVATTYTTLIGPLTAAVASLLPAHRSAAPERDLPPTRFGCFDAPSRLEPMWDGHKLVALAIYQGRDGLLAQASMPLATPRLPEGLPHTLTPGPVVGLCHFRPELDWPQVAAAVCTEVAAHFAVTLHPAQA